MITGSVDRSIRVWRPDVSNPNGYVCACTLEGHQGTINAFGAADGTEILASGAADGTVRIWRLTVDAEGALSGKLLQTIVLQPRYFPLTLALQVLDAENPAKPMALAVGGTMNRIQIYSTPNTVDESGFVFGARLSGHEAWIRALAFTADRTGSPGDLMLASASQDKYIRLWRVQRGEVTLAAPKDDEEPVLGGDAPTLTNKAHTFQAAGKTYSVTFEALLLGHEDWIYTARWNPRSDQMQLLSASADNSLTIWEQDPYSGVWAVKERMGEISVQKGSTTATGTTGGFWIGLWSSDGKTVVSLSRTGSWRAWKYDEDADMWSQHLGISGHVRSVNDLQWEATGGYLLTTSADQTSRLHAKWRRPDASSWHEFSRPQIHGYDLNCIDSLGPARFISGADEKLLRVFNEPKPIAQLLSNLAGVAQPADEDMPDAANIPVLGLSNKAIGEDVSFADEDALGEQSGGGQAEPVAPISLPTHQPPLEDHLARYTLWPEHEKLYGHGYEISAVAVSHDRAVIATACKASSIDHAVIRLYDGKDWHEIKPPLTAHSLTVTSLRFSSDDKYLLSVGRDRQWAVFQRDEASPEKYTLFMSNPRGHSRMILDAAWAPDRSPPLFATAGRDKSVKLWQLKDQGNGKPTFECTSTINLQSPATAVSFHPSHGQSSDSILAIGDDTGRILLYSVASSSSADALEVKELSVFEPSISPSKAITRLAWRPGSEQDRLLLAVASEDCSLRIYAVEGV